MVVLSAAPDVARADAPLVSAKPGLFPAFRSSVHDYVVRCAANPVKLVVRPRGARAAVDGGRLRKRRFRAAVALQPGEALTVTRVTRRNRREYHVRCLPADFPKYSYQRFARPKEAYDIVTPSPYVAVFDRRGVPVWWQRASGPLPQDAKVFADQTIGWFSSSNPFVGPRRHEIHRLDGTVVARPHVRRTAPDFKREATDAHDIQQLANGDFLVAAYKRRAGTVDLTACGGPQDAITYDAEVQRIRKHRKAPVWTWNSKDHIAVAESRRWCPSADLIPQPDGTNGYDIVHLNSMQLRGNDLLLSFRHTDGVYNVDYRTGDIRWKLGGTPTAQSLGVLGDTVTPTLGGQHFARFTGPDTVSLHDNGTFLGRAPRGLEVRVDRAKRTARVIDQVSEPLAPSSFCCGSSQRFADGTWLSGWGGTSVVSEFGPRGGRRFVLRFKGTSDIGAGVTTPEFSYRVAPVLPGRLKRRDLRNGMDAMHPPTVPGD